MQANITPGTFAVKTAHSNHQLCQKTVGWLISLIFITFRLLIDFKIFLLLFLIYKIFLEMTATFANVSKTISFPVMSPGSRVKQWPAGTCQPLTCSQVVYPLQSCALNTTVLLSSHMEGTWPLHATRGKQAGNTRNQEMILLLTFSWWGMQRNREKAPSITPFSYFGELVFAI